MPRKQTLEIPSDIGESLPNLITKRKPKVRTPGQRRKRQAAAKEKRQAREHEIQKQKKIVIRYARQIFRWARDLRANDVGKELIELGDRVRRKGFCFFDDKAPGVSQEWLFIDRQGIKHCGYGCGSRERLMSTPEALANTMGPENLQLVCERIKSGEIWDFIRHRFGITKKSGSRIHSRELYGG